MLAFSRVLFVAVATVCLLAPGRPAWAPPADEPEAAARVIIEIGRHNDVRGRVELEDDDIIVIRTAGGSVRSFAKTRLARIVRLVDPGPGQEGVVILRNGQQRRGIIVEDAFDYVIVEVEGIRSKLVRDIVDYVVLEPTFEERYEQYKQALEPNQADLHLLLCNWLYRERRYELTRAELISLLDEAGESASQTVAVAEIVGEAKRMLKLVDAQLALGGPRTRPEPPPKTDPGVSEPSLDEDGLVSREAVNLIRVYEIDFDHPPKVTVSPETIGLLIEHYGTNDLIPIDPRERVALHRADPLDIVRLMFELRARDLYSEVTVHTEPRALNLFRQRVHNAWLVKNCATSQCHNRREPGRFFLHRNRYKDERVRYTNLLLLERLDVDPIWPLVNYEEPSMSLIIQYGLPRHLSRRPHPDVRGWKPVFSNPNSRLLRESVEWIDAMMRPRPVYPVEVTIPQQRAGDPDSRPISGDR